MQIQRENTRLTELNGLAQEVSRVVRRTLECVRLLSTVDPLLSDEPCALLVSSLRSLSNCLEGVFDSLEDSPDEAVPQVVLPAAPNSEREQQLLLSKGLLRRMKELILQGAQLIQEAKQPQSPERFNELEHEFTVIVQHFVLDLKEIIRLQLLIIGLEPSPRHYNGTSSGPCSLPSRATSSTSGDPPTSADALARDRKSTWLKAGVGSGSSETGERAGPPAHPAARRLMSWGRQASHEALSGAASSSDEPLTGATPTTMRPYRKSRIVYGFKLKEGAVKLKVELQQKDEQAEGSSEEGRNGGKEDITDEQFVGMMLNFFGEMEQRKAALGRAPATPARNPRPTVGASVAVPPPRRQPARSPPPSAAVPDSGVPPSKGGEATTLQRKEAPTKAREGKRYMCILS